MSELEYLDSYRESNLRHAVYWNSALGMVTVRVFSGESKIYEKDLPPDVKSPRIQRILAKAGVKP